MKKLLLILIFIPLFFLNQTGYKITDKDKHDQAGMLISGLAGSSCYYFTERPWLSCGAGFAAAITAGIGKELYDKYSKNGTPDIWDAVSTGFGGARMFIILRIGINENEKHRLKIDTLAYQLKEYKVINKRDL